MLYTARETRKLLEAAGVACIADIESDDSVDGCVEVTDTVSVQVLSTGGWCATRGEGSDDNFAVLSMGERHVLADLIADIKKLASAPPAA